jgi:hypothetical protein
MKEGYSVSFPLKQNCLNLNYTNTPNKNEMIIYGTNARKIAQEVVADRCEKCGSDNTINLVIHQRYAHVFWIPSFPIGRITMSECSNCHNVLKKKEFPPTFSHSLDIAKQKARTPVWTFAGAAIFVTVITWAIISNAMDKNESRDFAKAPKEGDIYQVQLKSDSYTLYKIAAATHESVFFFVNEFETNKSSGLDDLRAKPFSEYVISFSRPIVEKMLENDEILDIDRP